MSVANMAFDLSKHDILMEYSTTNYYEFVKSPNHLISSFEFKLENFNPV